MIRIYAEIFCWKNVSSFCSAKATHIFSAKNIRILYIESAKTVNEMTLNELVKLTTLWTTGPSSFQLQKWGYSVPSECKCFPYKLAPVWRQVNCLKGSMFLKNRHFFTQERFNTLINGINMIIKCGIWQSVNFTLVSHFWTGWKLKWFFIIFLN